MKTLRIVVFAFLSAWLFCAHANTDADYQLLIKEVRCVTCPNQSIAESNAPIAISMRHEIQSRLQSNESVADIKAFLVERYGNEVLYQPPVEQGTWFLWFAPFAVLIAALLFWLIKVR